MNIDNFWSKVDKTDTCWNWKGTKNPDGYGLFRVDKIKVGSHRFSYELHKGKISKGFVIDHLCRNRSCVNPDHLEVVSNKENILRGISQSATNAKKTHCKHGHILSGDNLIIYFYKGKKHRYCKICSREKVRRYQMRKIREVN